MISFKTDVLRRCIDKVEEVLNRFCLSDEKENGLARRHPQLHLHALIIHFQPSPSLLPLRLQLLQGYHRPGLTLRKIVARQTSFDELVILLFSKFGVFSLLDLLANGLRTVVGSTSPHQSMLFNYVCLI